ncbi:MAG: MtaA/CmuA family methyltransferase [Deltaproteobacteria bacterium]|nr:MAG: MtaA/CmuA family methyltransferase [Deltaproteobacteria bacterium]
MNPIDRFLRVLANQTTDRAPVIGVTNSVTLELMDAVGTKFPEAHHDPDLMMKLGAAAHDLCGLESVKVPFDMTVEAGALGAEVDFGTVNTLPHIKGPLFETPESLTLKGDDLRQGRVSVILEAIRRSRQEYSGIPVISSIVGPFTLSTLLFGLERLFLWMLKDPDRYAAALQKATQLCTLYARHQFEAGSHAVQIADPSSSRDLISSEQYGKFVAPYHKRLCSSFNLPTVIHICGNITGHLPRIVETGARGISFDYKTDIGEAKRCLKGKLALIGYVPTSLLREGKPQEVYAFSRKCIEAGIDALNAGCAWPLDTPTENIRAMVRAAKEK